MEEKRQKKRNGCARFQKCQRVAVRRVHDCLSAPPKQTHRNWCSADIYAEILLPSPPGVVFTETNVLPPHVQVCSWGVNPPSVGVILAPGHPQESTHIFHIFAKTPFALHNKCARHIQPMYVLLIRPNQPENTRCKRILAIWRASNPGFTKKEASVSVSSL